MKTEEEVNQKTVQPPRVKGSEVFVGGLTRTVTEDMIRELFSSCGEVVEIRMMKDQNGALKGYCFVRFATKEAAMKAQKEKSNITLQGKKIGVLLSSDKNILFLGSLRKEWVPEEVESMVRQAFQDVVSVELAMPQSTGESPADKRKLNRGFAFVHFASHAAAARAHRVGSKQDFMLGGKWHPVVDWAETDTQLDPDEMEKIKVAFVGNLPNNSNEDFLRKLFEPFGKLERIAIARKNNMPVGFVRFTARSIDIQCLTSLRELPEVTAVAILEQFATNNFADGRNKGAYLAGLIARYKVDSLASRRIPMLHQGQSSDLPSRDAGLFGITGTNNFSLLDPLVASRPMPGSALLRQDPYAAATSLGGLSQVPPLLTGGSLLERMPTRLNDIHGLSSYRAPASTGFNLGSGLPEASITERHPPVKFDPFTGQPFKFDPFTGEPIQQPGPVSMPSSHFTGKYY